MSSQPPNKAVFLDRDGVLTQSIVRHGKPYAAQTLEEFVILPESAPALRRLKDAGFKLIVVTNQPDIATGKNDLDTLNEMHQLMSRSLPIDSYEVCVHVDTDGCLCRKPLPGLILAAAKRDGINLAESYMIGDRWRDTEAGRAAGCITIWIHTDYAEKKPQSFDFEALNIGDAANWILNQSARP